MEQYKASLKEYTEHYKAKGYTFGTLDERGRSVRLFLEYLKESGIKCIEDVDRQTIENFKGFLYRRAERLKLPLKAATLSSKLESARHFLVYFRDQKGITARALLEDREARLEEKAIKRDSEIPEAFREAFNRFMEQKRRENTSERSLGLLRYGLKVFFWYLTLERHIGSLSELRREDIKEFTGYLIDKPCLKNGIAADHPLSMSSVNKHIDALRVFLIWLSKKGEYPNCYNIHTSVRRVNEGDKVSRNIFTRKELSALFNRKAENPSEFMMKAIFVILYASGLRCGELLSMKLSDIDEAHFFENKEAVFYEPKTRKERIVQFGEVGAAYLRLYLENIRPKAEQRRSPEESALLFITGREHGRMDVQYVNRVLKKFVLKSGIKKNVSSHSFRHSYGTHILENGAGIKEVSELLGHNSIETTQGYTRLAPERLRETLLKYHPREKA